MAYYFGMTPAEFKAQAATKGLVGAVRGAVQDVKRAARKVKAYFG